MGGGFLLGATGGFLWHFVKGYRNAPIGQRWSGAFAAARVRSPVLGGQFGVWGGLFSVFDCSLAALRRREDAWNAIAAGGITGGVALSKMSELDVRCPEHNRCSSTVKPLYDEMQTLATASNVLVPLGLLTAAAGIVGLMKFSVPQATAAVRLGPGTVALEGAF
jgi:hypothetical protein